jgi:anti-sigma regulatory factor (Ser/Thr protein kinase)
MPALATAPAAIDRSLDVRADPSELITVRRLVETAAARFGLGERERFDFTFAVNEAVSNAIEHGLSSPEGTIRVGLATDGDALVFSVEDYGTFVPKAPAVDVFAERGRGLAFMAAVVDEVDVKRGDSGTIVRLCMRRSNGNGRSRDQAASA